MKTSANNPAQNPVEPLPTDVAGCHALIGRLREELAEARRELSVHEENERREMEYRYGKGVTAQDLLGFGQRFSLSISNERLRETEEEIAAEDAARRMTARRGRTKK